MVCTWKHHFPFSWLRDLSLELTVDVTLVKKPFHIFLHGGELDAKFGPTPSSFFLVHIKKGDIYIKRLVLRASHTLLA